MDVHDQTYTITELEEASSFPRRTIHFYVQQKILDNPIGAGLAARYTTKHLRRLLAIRSLRKQGVRSLDEIRQRLTGPSETETARRAPEDPQAVGALFMKRQNPSAERGTSTGDTMVSWTTPEPFAAEAAPCPFETLRRYSITCGIDLVVNSSSGIGADDPHLVRMLTYARQLFAGDRSPIAPLNSAFPEGGNECPSQP